MADGIQGRPEAILRLPASAGGQGRMHPVVIHQVIGAAPAAAWHVIQRPGRLQVLVAGSRPDFEPGLVTSRLRQVQGAAVPEIMVEHVTAIPGEPAGRR